jgi:hypothetical protein
VIEMQRKYKNINKKLNDLKANFQSITEEKQQPGLYKGI